ncbi:MAG: hypothetical protein NTW90_05980 [Nitrosospira sp.]|nr:hypothetical protein [Nitrosospira sp.]
MKVTVIAMRMMQVAVNQIIHMIAMRNLLMPASRTVDMASIMTGTDVIRGALGGVRGTDLQYMLVNMRTVDMVQMAIVQIVGMTGVVYGQMSAAWTMLVIVMAMLLAGIHAYPPVMVDTTVNL